jgi:carbon-monoxide dehydrogenase iron sulfur subunit
LADNNTAKRIFVDQDKCLGCKTCELRCAVERNSVSKVLTEAVHEEILPRPRVYVESDGTDPVVIQCRHCEEAPCLEICSTGALQRDPETGAVFVDVNKCIACWMCVMVCPYGVIAPATEKHAADKCDQCFQMAGPCCVAACPTGALVEMTPAEFALKIKKRREKGLDLVEESLSREG